jgi:hypothetical protein
MWTHFIRNDDNNKYKYEDIYIETSKRKAIKIFINRFGYAPINTICACCESPYYCTTSRANLSYITGNARNCYVICNQTKKIYKFLDTISKIPKKWELLTTQERDVIPLDIYLNQPDTYVIFDDDFTDEEKDFKW